MDINMNAIAKMYESDPLFSSAHAALVFTFNFSSACYDRPAMNKMAAPAVGTGKGLGGLDGAAQAGFVRAELKLMGAIGEAMLTARVAPKFMPCECRRPCCAGNTPNVEYVEAINTLTRYALTKIPGCLSHAQMRKAIVERHFGAPLQLSDIADKCGVNKNTAVSHNATITKAFIAEESAAWATFEDRLTQCGMVESAAVA